MCRAEECGVKVSAYRVVFAAICSGSATDTLTSEDYRPRDETSEGRLPNYKTP